MMTIKKLSLQLLLFSLGLGIFGMVPSNDTKAGQRGPYTYTFDLKKTPQKPDLFNEKIDEFSLGLNREETIKILQFNGYTFDKNPDSITLKATHSENIETNIKEPTKQNTNLEIKLSAQDKVNEIHLQRDTSPPPAYDTPKVSPVRYHPIAWYDGYYATEINTAIEKHCHPAIKTSAEDICTLKHEKVVIKKTQQISKNNQEQTIEFKFEASPKTISKTLKLISTER